MGSPRMLTVAAIQLAAAPRAWGPNTARAAEWIGRAVAWGARLVLLPELFAIGSFYAPDLLTFAEPPTGRTARWLRATARAHGIVVAGTILERRRDRVRNTLLIAGPDGRVARYAKRRLGVEAELGVSPGHRPNVLPTTLGGVGCLICSDGNDAGLKERIAQADVGLALVPQAIGATERLGRLVERRERGGSEPLWGEIVRQLGVPTVTAGLVGPLESATPERVGDFLRGGTYVIDAAGRGLAHVPFPSEGAALATIRLGRAACPA